MTAHGRDGTASKQTDKPNKVQSWKTRAVLAAGVGGPLGILVGADSAAALDLDSPDATTFTDAFAQPTASNFWLDDAAETNYVALDAQNSAPWWSDAELQDTRIDITAKPVGGPDLAATDDEPTSLMTKLVAGLAWETEPKTFTDENGNELQIDGAATFTPLQALRLLPLLRATAFTFPPAAVIIRQITDPTPIPVSLPAISLPTRSSQLDAVTPGETSANERPTLSQSDLNLIFEDSNNRNGTVLSFPTAENKTIVLTGSRLEQNQNPPTLDQDPSIDTQLITSGSPSFTPEATTTSSLLPGNSNIMANEESTEAGAHEETVRALAQELRDARAVEDEAYERHTSSDPSVDPEGADQARKDWQLARPKRAAAFVKYRDHRMSKPPTD